MPPTAARLQQAFSLTRDRVEARYGIPVLIIDVPDPFTGDLDGAEIHLDYASPDDLQLFTLAHLFGHTVQWSQSSRFWTVGAKPPKTYSAEDLVEVDEYERDASRYGITLLHEVGVHDLDGWLSDFSACDRAYLEHFYRTGEKRPPMELWRDGTAVLTPLPIPEFTPHPARFRWDGVVI
ncbi:MAG TPA: hypothetical protein VFE33_09060 [Thermoanaerobaculia bacterium]|nr:hypothetical protein [Thermoanaerobaculia bacterium]